MGIKQEEAFGNLSAFKPIQPAPVSLNKTSCITTNTPTMATASDFTVTVGYYPGNSIRLYCYGRLLPWQQHQTSLLR